MKKRLPEYDMILNRYLVMLNEMKNNPQVIDAIVDLYELPQNDENVKKRFKKQVEENFSRVKFIPYMKISEAEKYREKNNKVKTKKEKKPKNKKKELRKREKRIGKLTSDIITLDDKFENADAGKILKKGRVTTSIGEANEPIEVYIPILGLHDEQEKVLVLHELLHVAEVQNEGRTLRTGFVTRTGNKTDKNKYEKLCENIHQRNSWKLYNMLGERNVNYLSEYPECKRGYNEYEQYNLITEVFYNNFFKDIMQARIGEMKPLIRTIGKKNFEQLALLTNKQAELVKRRRNKYDEGQMEIDSNKVLEETMALNEKLYKRKDIVFQKLMRRAMGRVNILDIFEFAQNRIDALGEKIQNKAEAFFEKLKFVSDVPQPTLARKASNKSEPKKKR